MTEDEGRMFEEYTVLAVVHIMYTMGMCIYIYIYIYIYIIIYMHNVQNLQIFYVIIGSGRGARGLKPPLF